MEQTVTFKSFNIVLYSLDATIDDCLANPSPTEDQAEVQDLLLSLKNSLLNTSVADEDEQEVTMYLTQLELAAFSYFRGFFDGKGAEPDRITDYVSLLLNQQEDQTEKIVPKETFTTVISGLDAILHGHLAPPEDWGDRMGRLTLLQDEYTQNSTVDEENEEVTIFVTEFGDKMFDYLLGYIKAWLHVADKIADCLNGLIGQPLS